MAWLRGGKNLHRQHLATVCRSPSASEDGFAPEPLIMLPQHGALCADLGTRRRGFCYMCRHHARQLLVSATRKPVRLSDRINRLPRWAQDYIMRVHTFVGAEEVEELVFLRDQNKALVKLVGELKAENRRLRKSLAG